MASRSVGIGWFAVGFLAGVGATLAVIIFATRPQPARITLAAPTAPAAPVVTYHPPVVPEGSPPPLAGSIPSRPQAAPTYAPAPAAAPRRAPDEQTQEDAAAAGMTSRARPRD